MNIKKHVIVLVAVVMIITSCTSYTSVGAGVGAYWGSSIGSAIGGIADGFRGSNIGSLIGMVGGAAVGAAICSEQDKAYQEDMQQYREEKARLAANREVRNSAGKQMTPENYNYEQSGMLDSGFDSNNTADDVIDLDISDNDRGVYGKEEVPANGMPAIEIRNARFFDSSGDGVLSRGEKSSIVFEIYNSGNATAYNIQPVVMETTGNKHILVSPSVTVEELAPNSSVRYTANIVADSRLKNGTVQFSIAVIKGNTTLSKVMDFTVNTAK